MNNIYVYPDGTTSVHEPSDGQVLVEWDVNQKAKRVWQWDGFKRQWFDFTVPVNPVPYKTKTPILTKAKCKRGSKKCGSNIHSSWCPKYQS
jgi:hypothetical protein